VQDDLNVIIPEAGPCKLGRDQPAARARVMMKFVELLHRDMDKLAETLSREHGKTIPDAKGDIIRGLEVASSALARRIC
jgi:malonate-semialdehyde dehydrogenase (acetylating)/methylmalonate-semialdehyde dehydrogenase